MTLAELRAKYGLSHWAIYEPNPRCSHCRGTGERLMVTKNAVSFCGCLYTKNIKTIDGEESHERA